MTSEDEAFYQDNCHEKYKATCSNTVCKKWLQGASRVQKRLLYYKKIQSESTSSSQLCEEEAAEKTTPKMKIENSDNCKDHLLAAVLSEVIETFHRQLGEMNFFVEILGQTIQPQQTDECKMKMPPLRT